MTLAPNFECLAADMVGVLANITALRAVTTTNFGASAVVVQGFSSAGDGGGGLFFLDSSDTSSADNTATIIVDSSNRRWYRDARNGPISAKWFGATGNGTTDDTTAIANWSAFLIANKKSGFLPAGRYIQTRQLTIDLGPVAGTGFKIFGEGSQQSILDFTQFAGDGAFYVIGSGGTVSSPKGLFYGEFKDFGVINNYNGVTVRWGQGNFADALNAFIIDNVWAGNQNTGTSACAMEFNYVLNSQIFIVCNCNGHGDAIRCRQADFCVFAGSGGSADYAVHLSGPGYNYGNVFNAMDLEVVSVCVLADSVNDSENTFIGGQFVWTGAALCEANNHNNYLRFININAASGSNLVTGPAAAAVQFDTQTVGTYAYQTALANNLNVPISTGGSGTLTVQNGGNLVVQSLAKVSFFGAALTGQPTNSGNSAENNAGTTNAVYQDTGFTGGVGATAYTAGQVVAALKNLGLIKS